MYAYLGRVFVRASCGLFSGWDFGTADWFEANTNLQERDGDAYWIMILFEVIAGWVKYWSKEKWARLRGFIEYYVIALDP